MARLADEDEERFVDMLRGGRNELGRTLEVVEQIEASPARLDELHQCFFQPDAWVRLRATSATKRLWRKHPEWLDPYIESWVSDVSGIEQPSVNWTFAEMCLDLSDRLTAAQRAVAVERMKGYLEHSEDWIVKKRSMATLTTWAKDETRLSNWLQPQLERLADDPRKSVASQATKSLATLRWPVQFVGITGCSFSA